LSLLSTNLARRSQRKQKNEEFPQYLPPSATPTIFLFFLSSGICALSQVYFLRLFPGSHSLLGSLHWVSLAFLSSIFHVDLLPQYLACSISYSYPTVSSLACDHCFCLLHIDDSNHVEYIGYHNLASLKSTFYSGPVWLFLDINHFYDFPDYKPPKFSIAFEIKYKIFNMPYGILLHLFLA
jgi:hypothetical protein